MENIDAFMKQEFPDQPAATWASAGQVVNEPRVEIGKLIYPEYVYFNNILLSSFLII